MTYYGEKIKVGDELYVEAIDSRYKPLEDKRFMHFTILGENTRSWFIQYWGTKVAINKNTLSRVYDGRKEQFFTEEGLNIHKYRHALIVKIEKGLNLCSLETLKQIEQLV